MCVYVYVCMCVCVYVCMCVCVYACICVCVLCVFSSLLILVFTSAAAAAASGGGESTAGDGALIRDVMQQEKQRKEFEEAIAHLPRVHRENILAQLKPSYVRLFSYDLTAPLVVSRSLSLSRARVCVCVCVCVCLCPNPYIRGRFNIGCVSESFLSLRHFF
jgi:hypothetical protein